VKRLTPFKTRTTAESIITEGPSSPVLGKPSSPISEQMGKQLHCRLIIGGENYHLQLDVQIGCDGSLGIRNFLCTKVLNVHVCPSSLEHGPSLRSDLVLLAQALHPPHLVPHPSSAPTIHPL
jgi:hypothetical protein